MPNMGFLGQCFQKLEHEQDRQTDTQTHTRTYTCTVTQRERERERERESESCDRTHCHAHSRMVIIIMWPTSGADFMGPEGLEPPPQHLTLSYGAHAIYQSPQYYTCYIGAVDVNTHKLAALQQRRRITNSFNSSLNANDIAAPYLITCVWGKS